VVFTGIVNGTSISINGLNPNTVYYWRVRVNESNNVSLWSVVWSFITTNSLNINDNDAINQIILYPVPADAKLFIKQNSLSLLVKYELFSIDGKFLSKGALDNDSSIDVNHLTSGIYLVKLFNEIGQIQTMKFSKI
jgi:hypothetical protein